MNLSTRKAATAVFVSLLLSLMRCVSLQGSGGTGDETVIGMIINEDGSPANATVVTLRSHDFDPTIDPINPECWIDTTDSGGRFSITIAASQENRFTLEAVHPVSRHRLIVSDIPVSAQGELVTIGTNMLHRIGRIKVVLSDSMLSGNGHVFIPGTAHYAVMENGTAIIDSVPAQTVHAIYYNEIEVRNASHRLAESVAVSPVILTIVAFSGAAYSAKIILNTTPDGAAVTGDVVNFPVLIRLSGSNFDFSRARTDGSDLRFTKTDNSSLPFEIERWDAAARLAEIWVRVDTIFGNDSTQCLAMYWGEPATVIGYNNTRVFEPSNGFRGVWHLSEEAPGIGNPGLYKDATGEHDGDDYISSVDRNGMIGYGHAFDGIDDFIPVNDAVTNFLQGDVTIALWVNIRDSGGTMLSKLDTTGTWGRGESSFYFGDGTDAHLSPEGPSGGRVSNGDRPSFVGFADDYAIAGQSITPDNWHYLVYTWKWNGDSTGTSRYYIDGIGVTLSRDSLRNRTGENVNATLRIGQPNNNESIHYFKGQMDELQISAVTRSADWIKLSYISQRKDNLLVRYP